MAQTQMIVIPADWPEPESLHSSLVRCGIPIEGVVATTLQRYVAAVAWLRQFADEIRRRVHEGHNHPRRQELFAQQGLAARALESLRELMRATIRSLRHLVSPDAGRAPTTNRSARRPAQHGASE